ncbi:ATP-binding protein [Clostridium amazonitimonense]|uniref:ATP-binding protein n=1 Tax=Clostridium amazonitimonense TaxID=1499689 RepID=UPI0005096AF8|nr:sensor histidine kinase [Clostridium amazonitimonense]
MKLRIKTSLLVIVIILFTLGTATGFSIIKMNKVIREQMGKNAMDIANTVASIKDVQDVLKSKKKNNEIQHIIENIRLKTRVQFITVMDMEAIRYSHPTPENIGKPFIGGDEKKVLETGQSYIAEGEGTLGPSLRAFSPIYKDGEQIGAVSVGILTGWISQEFQTLLYEFIPYIVIALTIGVIGAWLLSTNIKNTIYGLEPKEIAWILKEREAILEDMDEGIIAINNKGYIILLNKNARNILRLKEDFKGKNISDLRYKGRFLEVLENKIAIKNLEERLWEDIIILSSYEPLIDNKGEIMGVLSTFRDLTEVRSLAEELTDFKNMTWSLRAQNHEFMNKLHTIGGLIELEEYDKALNYIYNTVENRNRIMKALSKIKDKTLAALILAKFNKASEGRIEFILEEDSFLESLPKGMTTDNITTLLGNLIENSIEATLDMEKGKIKLRIRDEMDGLYICLENNGEAIDEDIKDKIYEKAVSSKGKGNERGYGMYNVKNIIDSFKGNINFTTGELTRWNIFIPKA